MGDWRIIVALALASSAILADGLAARQEPFEVSSFQQTASPPKIEVQSILVNEPVTVRDAKGVMILGLQASDFHLTDNGVPQKITHFEVGGGDALSLVIVVETSLRVEAVIPKLRKIGTLVTQTVMGPNAEAAVVGFNDKVDKLQDFTTNPDAIEKVFAHLDYGTSGSKLYEALEMGVDMLSERPKPTPKETGRRRIMLVLSEADDHGSEARLETVLRRAQLENVTIWSVGLSTVHALLEHRAKMKPTDPDWGDNNLIPVAKWAVTHMRDQVSGNLLEIAAAATGGSFLSVWKDRSIEKAIDEIGGELHAQYLLMYIPAGDETQGFHEIQVSVDRPKVKIKCRPGYSVGESN